MSATVRQNSLMVNQDWTKIYTAFTSADFQSYDFETLRKSMIDYLRLYYPEDFNDYVESSEYIALIDLIAFLGQSLAFRTDLNARENFLDTAERRDSILKLARLISYNPKRSIAASGLLKFTSVSTTESITDSNGINLTNTVVSWNDTTNSNWNEQFTLILNAALINSQVIGKSGNSKVINGIQNDEYTLNITSNTVGKYPFTAVVNGSNTNFEAVSATSANEPYIYEVAPAPSNLFNILYRNDNQGNSSNNTGFFFLFKQGILQSSDFNISDSIPNRILNIGYNNINNIDVWLYDLNSALVENNLWTDVPAIAGVNVIYNKSTDRNLYQINTIAGDQIDLVFGDGSFSNIPQGNFRIYFRVSNGLTYKITPDEMQNSTISINYVSRTGNTETLTVRASLNYTVTNANANESIDDIRLKAPQQYYTQGRMITGEDYNIVPYTSFSDILKVKALNRMSSGVSRYIDVSDTTGKYSSTNIFAEDGYLYEESALSSQVFTYTSTANIQQMVSTDLNIILTSNELRQFYYANALRPQVVNIEWHLSSLTSNGSTGYYVNSLAPTMPIQIGYVVSSTNPVSYIRTGAIVQFAASTNFITTPKYFNNQNQIKVGVPTLPGDKLYIYSSVMQVIGDGTNGGVGNFTNGSGPVTMSQQIPNGAIVSSIIPMFVTNIPSTLATTIATNIIAFNNFGLRYDIISATWQIVLEKDMAIPTTAFSFAKNGATDTNGNIGWAGDTSGNFLDSSWMIQFIYNATVGYTINWRSLSYIFGSELETTFYFDNNVKVYDSHSGTTIKDLINVLKINTQPDSTSPLGIDYTWDIYQNIVDSDGYENQNNILITFTDSNNDGVPDNPDLFTGLVDTTSVLPSLIFFQQNTGYNSFVSYSIVSAGVINSTYVTLSQIQADETTYTDGQVFYATTDMKFYQLSVVDGVYTLTEVTNYVAKIGRQDMYFQYRHNSPGYRRIDPTPNNIIDLYLLTNTYANDYTSWIQDTTGIISEPTPPTTDELTQSYGTLNNSKAVSDTIIFNSASFKPLFGNNAAPALQGTFKVVKNPSVNVSDNDIKSSVINAINTYFAVSNWDFGETFYFSELSAYLHTQLSPNLSSIVLVPSNPNALFGSLYQVNSEANELMISSATVENIEIISAITAAQINASYSGVNTTIALGSI